MENIKFFNLQKNDKDGNEKAPDYRISFRDGNSFIEGGACWKKQDKNGNTYLSCKLRDTYKEKKGYIIIEEGSVKPQEPQGEDF